MITLSPGTVLDDRYIIEGPLGSGGIANVFAARHVTLQTLHAVKVVAVPSPEVQARLLQEGRLQGSLRHPNVVSVTDVVTVRGSPGLVMELIDGPTLAELLNDHPPSLAQADSLARGILSGVVAAHAHGLVHRDLKPRNILLAPNGRELMPKIADFGLAKILEARGGMNTRQGAILGTPNYMAPEQIRNAADTDARADVFALGAVLYELVTGEKAFPGSNMMEVFRKIDDGQYRPPRELAANLPGRMERAIVGALRTERSERIQTAEDLMEIWFADATSDGPGSWDGDVLQAMRRTPGIAVRAGEVPVAVSAGQTIDFSSMGDSTQQGLQAPSPPPRWPLVVGALVAVGGVVAGGMFWSNTSSQEVTPEPIAAAPPVPAQVVETRLTHSPASVDVGAMALSPSGKHYVVDVGGAVEIHRLKGGPPKKLNLPTEGFADLAWTPDGEELLITGINGERSLPMIVSLDAQVRKTFDREAFLARMSPDGRFMAYLNKVGLHVQDLGSGRVETVFPHDASVAVRSVAWAPDSERLVAIVDPGRSPRIVVITADGSSSRVLFEHPNLTQAPGTTTIAWRDAGKLLFVQGGRSVSGEQTGLWELAVDDEAEPKLLHTWPGSVLGDLAVLPDGALIYARQDTQSDVVLAPLCEPGNPRRLTLHDRNDRPTGWTSDGRVLFMSDRYGSWDLLVQAPGSTDAERLIESDDWETWGRQFGDSLWYWQIEVSGADAGSYGLMRRDPEGTQRQVIAAKMEWPIREVGRPPPFREFDCTVDLATCVVSAPVGDQQHFARFDPESGELEAPFLVLDATETTLGLDLSPDGKQMAFSNMTHILIASVESGEIAHELELMPHPQYPRYSADGSVLYVTGMAGESHSEVWRVNLEEGKFETLITAETGWYGQPAPSPDGCELALLELQWNSDVWMLKGLP